MLGVARAWGIRFVRLLPITQRRAFVLASYSPALRVPPTYRRSPVARITTMGNQGISKDGVKVYDHGDAPPPSVTFTEEELRAKLSEEEYNVTQMKGTDRAWTGRYLDVKDDGTFECVVCHKALFKTDKKFESGSGWPSFTDVAAKGSVVLTADKSGGMVRTEATCANCGAHLGHVFEDGPKEDTGLRYCINGTSLKFSSKDEPAKEQSEAAKSED